MNKENINEASINQPPSKDSLGVVSKGGKGTSPPGSKGTSPPGSKGTSRDLTFPPENVLSNHNHGGNHDSIGDLLRMPEEPFHHDETDESLGSQPLYSRNLNLSDDNPMKQDVQRIGRDEQEGNEVMRQEQKELTGNQTRTH
jgi:hypothetical protein